MREKKRTAQETSIPEISQDVKKKNKASVVSVPVEILRDIQFNMIDVKLFQKNILDKSDLILLKSYTSNDEMVEILFELLRNKSEEHHDNFLDVIKEDYSWLTDKCEILLQKMRLDLLKGLNTASSHPHQVTKTAASVNQPVAEKSSPDSIPLQFHSNCESSSNVQGKSVIDDNNLNNTSPKEKCPAKHLEMPKLTQSMISVVRRNHRVVRGWTNLAHVLGMTQHIPVVRMRMIINGEDMDACVIHILQEWQGRDPKNATLEKLILALREEEFNEVADELEAKFASSSTH